MIVLLFFHKNFVAGTMAEMLSARERNRPCKANFPLWQDIPLQTNTQDFYSRGNECAVDISHLSEIASSLFFFCAESIII